MEMNNHQNVPASHTSANHHAYTAAARHDGAARSAGTSSNNPTHCSQATGWPCGNSVPAHGQASANA